MIKVLNLYAGIGGNRKLWPNHEIEVTAVEIDPKIAIIYADHFPNDKIIIDDAHQYLLEHFEEYDFIWSSPPCPSHSRIRKCYYTQNPPVFPDMKLYEEVLFLQGYFKGLWVVENVISWYGPLIKPQESASHYFWANFIIPKLANTSRKHYGELEELEELKGFDLSNVDIAQKRVILRNCVEPEIALTIFKAAFKDKQKRLI